MFCYCLTQSGINYKATLADGTRVARLIHDSLHDIMFLASLQRIVRCTSSKEERQQQTGTSCTAAPLPPHAVYEVPCAVLGAPFTAEQ